MFMQAGNIRFELGFRTGALSKTFPSKSIHTEISPLRYAPVEMTKERAVLPRK
jgi:hypothetical protein